MIKKYFSRFPHAIRGILYAVRHDFGFRTQVYLGAVVLSGTLALFHPLSSTEWLFLILAWALIFITELQNSALEAALDRLHPELHDQIKHSKDMAASSVLLAGLFMLLVLVAISLAWLV